MAGHHQQQATMVDSSAVPLATAFDSSPPTPETGGSILPLTIEDVLFISPKFWDLHTDPIASIYGAATLLALQYNLCADTFATCLPEQPSLAPTCTRFQSLVSGVIRNAGTLESPSGESSSTFVKFKGSDILSSVLPRSRPINHSLTYFNRVRLLPVSPQRHYLEA